MDGLVCVTLRQRPELKQRAAAWFHAKWGVPEAAYMVCMEAYLCAETEYGWYLCLDGGRIVGGLGVIENDFHARKDLAPNICAVSVSPPGRGGEPSESGGGRFEGAGNHTCLSVY